MGTGTELSFNSMFNVHNSVSLAGYGYFPPIFYQGIFNKGNPDVNPMTGDRMIGNPEKNNFQLFVKILFIILIVICVLL